MDPITVDQMYGPGPISPKEVAAVLDRSLDPRPSTSLYDTVEALGIGAGDLVLDIGGRDARHSVALAERLGCRVIAMDPVAANVEDGRRLIAAGDQADLVAIAQAHIEAIPAPDTCFDLVFWRDVLGHIADLPAALAECSRVLVPGGGMVIYETFATDRLEPQEAAHLSADLAMPPENLAADRLENAASDAGFVVESFDVIGSEWREAWEEDGSRRTSRQLLHAARLLRAPGQLRVELGDVDYRVELANALWGIYQMIGKLEPRIYTLRKA